MVLIVKFPLYIEVVKFCFRFTICTFENIMPIFLSDYMHLVVV